MSSDLEKDLAKLTIDTQYKPTVISPTFSSGKFHLELSLKEFNFISSALDAKYRAMVAARKKTAADREAKVASGAKVAAPRSVQFYSVVLESVN
jgi:hypothetical protein